MKSNNFTKSTKGAAGVHLVVAQLSLQGYVALPTTRNLKSVDIVAFNEKLSRHAFIQVKSTDKPTNGWLVRSVQKEDAWEQDIRAALSLGKRFFYVFVLLPSPSRPQPAFYIVRSADVAERVIKKVNQYLNHSGRKAAHQLCIWGSSKSEQPDIGMYKDKWEILGLQT